MYGDAPLSELTGVPAWLTPGEQHALYELAQAVPKKGVIVEIGGQWGGSASIFCKGALPNVTISTVDLFPDDWLQHHRDNLTEAGFEKRSDQLQGDSAEVVLAWAEAKPNKIDLLFIDGDHSINGSRADFENWTPFVKVGGFMAAHDCACATNPLPHHLHFDVTHSLSAWYWQNGASWKLVKTVDSLMIFERVK